MWTMDNTENFTQDQLNIINVIHSELVAEGMNETAANDRINNAWNDKIHTAADLREAVRR